MTQPHEPWTGRIIRRRGWFLLAAAIAILLSFGQAGTVQANGSTLVYVTSAGDIDAPCDAVQAGRRCCTGVACAGYAQLDAEVTPSVVMDGGGFLPAIQADRTGQTLRPATQPPQA